MPEAEREDLAGNDPMAVLARWVAESGIERIVVTDTIPLRPGAPDNITVLSTAGTFADSIRRIFTDDSVSEIFAGENQLF